ncbi:MAG TPA: hypothetical protein VKY90_07740 [Candidatus Dormibacteraeota bacterium]|nr:hypothetical protein [Candidatus Dormibacteraeota bacterium]
MNLRAAFLVQEAMQNSDGTFMGWRGGVDNLGVLTFPALLHVYAVLRFEADAKGSRQLHRLRMRVTHQTVEGPWQEVPTAFKEPPSPDQRSHLNLLMNVNLGVRGPGPGRVEVAADDVLIAPALVFRVNQIQPPPAFPPTPRRRLSTTSELGRRYIGAKGAPPTR